MDPTMQSPVRPPLSAPLAGMIFSVPQWLAIFVLDVLIKWVLITIAGMFSLIGPPRTLLAELASSAPIAAALFSFHLGCLILGYAATAALEMATLELSARLKFWLGLLFANVLFGAIMNTLTELSSAASPRIFEISSVTVAAVATNLLPILAMYLCDCIFRFGASSLRRLLRNG